jgi:hypothetical protein
VIGLLARVAATFGNARALENARRGLVDHEWALARIDAIARRHPVAASMSGDGSGDPVRAA